MASAIPLRSDFDGASLRRLARARRDAKDNVKYLSHICGVGGPESG